MDRKEIMARYIYSKVQPGKLLHIIHRLLEANEKREDIVPPDNFLQIATIRLKNNQTFKAHRHLWNHSTNTHSRIANESWIVVRGKVKAILYDLDNSLLEEIILYPGDFSATIEGGHNYLCLDDNTLVYEIKTGPYLGQELDKEFI
jgi:hypothetical protein